MNDLPVHRCGHRVADAHDRLGQPDHDPTADWWCSSCEEYYGDQELDIGELGRPDWVKCIAAQPGRTGTTLCGRERWSHYWTFTDVEHARATVARGDRLQPCESCMAAAGSTWRTRSPVPWRTVVVVDRGHEVHLPLREIAARVPPGTPESYRGAAGSHWLTCQVVIGPRHLLERACRESGLSLALSWLASEWSRRQGLDVQP